MKKKLVLIENNILATNTIRRKLTSSLMEDYDVTVLTTGTFDELKLARDRGFTVIDIKASTQNPLDILKYIRNLHKQISLLKPDVCLTFTIRPAIWGNLVTRVLKIKTITNITGVGPLFESDNLAYKAARKLYKFVLQKTAVVFFQNDDDMHLFLENKFVDPSKIRRIPGSGVDHEEYKPLQVEPNEKFQFLFISRLIRDKGILEYVEAARLLKGLINAEFRVIGPYWSQNLKDNIIAPADMEGWMKEGIINYLGAKDDVKPFIAQADCIVLPSYREGTSNVLLEAASMARPAVTCDTTGCRDIVIDGETGFLCEVRNATDLADKMMQMYNLSDAERHTMGSKARQHIIENFDKKIVINAYRDAIRQVLS